MNLVATPTDQLVVLQGVRCRVWHGTTSTGFLCYLFVQRVYSPSEALNDRFTAEVLDKLPRGRLIPREQVK